MTRDAILEDLHAARRRLLAQYGGDVAAYLRDAQARLDASGRPIARRKQRRARVGETAAGSPPPASVTAGSGCAET